MADRPWLVAGIFGLLAAGALIFGLAAGRTPKAQAERAKAIRTAAAAKEKQKESAKVVAPAPPPVVSVASPATQSKRLDLIQQLQADQIIHRIDTGTYPVVRVLPAFTSLLLEDKRLVLQVVWSWTFGIPDDQIGTTYTQIHIHDARSGKYLGWYSGAQGLRLKD